MSGKTSIFVDNSAPAVDAAWLNIIQTENKNIIESSGQTLADGTLDQEATSMASYAGQAGVFTIDSGAADAYVLTQVSPFKAPYSYKNGLTIRFRAGNANTGACTVNPFSLGVKNIKKADGSTNPAAGDISTTQDTLLRYDGTNFRIISNFVTSQLPLGSTVQIVNIETGASATGTGTIAINDTPPSNTDGDQYMSLSITPQSVTNTLYVDLVFYASSSALGYLIAALFQDSGVSAIATGVDYVSSTTGIGLVIFRHKILNIGTTSSITFKARGGNQSGTMTFNGTNGNRVFGGTMASSITITEIKA